MNTTRVSNFFIGTRVVSYSESLAMQGFPLFYVHPMHIRKHQNCKDVFKCRHRYMNMAFRYSYFDMLLQTLAVSCISAFDGGEPHYKNGYTLCVLGQYLPQPDGGVRDEGLGRMCWRDAKDF